MATVSWTQTLEQIRKHDIEVRNLFAKMGIYISIHFQLLK